MLPCSPLALVLAIGASAALAATVRAPAAVAAEPPPVVLWASAQVAPNTTLLLQGYFPRPTRTAAAGPPDPCSLLCGGTVVDAVANASTTTSLAFVIPGSSNSSVSCAHAGCTVSCDGGATHSDPPFFPNAPEIWWILGSTNSGRYNASSGSPQAGTDGAETATPGGHVRLFGRNFGTAPSAKLVREVAGSASLDLGYVAAQSSDNTAYFTIPPSAPVSATVGWSIALATASPCALATTAPGILLVNTNDGIDHGSVFNVTRVEDLPGALEAAAAAPRGGIVQFSKGRFKISGGPINLPSNTMLRGAGMDATSLWWDDNPRATQARSKPRTAYRSLYLASRSEGSRTRIAGHCHHIIYES